MYPYGLLESNLEITFISKHMFGINIDCCTRLPIGCNVLADLYRN